MITYTDMLEEIYRYECAHNMNKSNTVQYEPEIKMYMLKKEMTNNEVKALYADIISKQEKEKGQIEVMEVSQEINNTDIQEEIKAEGAEKQSVQVSVMKELRLKDSCIYISKQWDIGEEVSTYSYKNLKNALKKYTDIKGKKAVGYKYDNKLYPIMKNDGNDGMSYESQSQDDIEFFGNYYRSIICENIIEAEELQIKKKEEELQARERALELRINPKYAKDYIKLIKKEGIKCLRNKDFTAYDFRGIKLNDMVFIDCNFRTANFTDIEISNTLFIRCDMSMITEDGTVYKNCEYIKCIKE